MPAWLRSWNVVQSRNRVTIRAVEVTVTRKRDLFIIHHVDPSFAKAEFNSASLPF